MTARRYRFAGLLFESDLDLPEWNVFRAAGAQEEPDVRIRMTGDHLGLGEQDVYRLSIPGVGSFGVMGGRQIDVVPQLDADAAEIRVFLLGTVLAALCCQRGLLLLHVSVVAMGDRAVAFCGPTGSGKSTLAAALVSRGATFLCDDLARFEVRDGRALVYPSTPRLKLSPDVFDTLGWSAGAQRVHSRARKFYAAQGHDEPWSPVPVRAICVLEWADAPLELTRLTGVQSLRALVSAATYRPGLVEQFHLEAAHWQQCAQLAASTAVYRLRRPLDATALRNATDLMGHFR